MIPSQFTTLSVRNNFADFIQEIPGTYAYVGSGNPQLPGTLHPVHSGDFDIDEEVLKAIEEGNDLAPLHNPANLIGIRA